MTELESFLEKFLKDVELEENQKKELEKRLTDYFSELTNKQKETEKQIEQLKKDKERAVEDMKKFIELKPFKELDPSKIDIYKKAEKIIENSKDIDKIKTELENSYNSKLEQIKSEYEKKIEELANEKGTLEKEYQSKLLETTLLGKIGNRIKKDVKPELVIKLLREKFKLNENGEIEYVDMPFNVKTGKNTTVEEAIENLAESDFKIFFEEKTATGIGAGGGSGAPGEEDFSEVLEQI